LENIFRDEFWVTTQYVLLAKDTITLLLPTNDAEQQGYFIESEIATCEVMQSLKFHCVAEQYM